MGRFLSRAVPAPVRDRDGKHGDSLFCGDRCKKAARRIMINMIRKAIIVVLTLGTLGTFSLGVASYFLSSNCVWRPTDHNCLIINSAALGYIFSHYHGRELPVPSAGEGCDYYSRQPFDLRWKDRVRGWRRFRYDEASYLRVASFPAWVPVVLFGAYPTLVFVRGPLRRYRRRKRSLCVTCGYDLRASPERCPECGCAS